MKAKEMERQQTKHTPGPWAVEYGDAERREMSTIRKANDPDFLIAYVLREWRNPHQQAEDDATARLIAAAPEMLAALKRAVTGVMDPEARNLAKAAIAKAEGK